MRAEINVTPLVDVVLVLLIIFMVITPMIARGVAVELPVTSHHDKKSDDNKDLIVSVTAGGDVYLGADKIALERLTTAVQDERRRNPDKGIFLKADHRARYGAARAHDGGHPPRGRRGHSDRHRREEGGREVMAFSVGGAKGRPSGDINVTPLIDIVLVLLIIFMVMTPVMLKELVAKVPQKSTELVPQPPGDNPIIVELDARDRLSLNGEARRARGARRPRSASACATTGRRSSSSRSTTRPTTAAPCGSWTSARARARRRSESSPRTTSSLRSSEEPSLTVLPLSWPSAIPSTRRWFRQLLGASRGRVDMPTACATR